MRNIPDPTMRRSNFARLAGAALLGLLAVTANSAVDAIFGDAADPRASGVLVTVAPMAIVRARDGITGAGWGVAYDVVDGARTGRKVVNLYPNHPKFRSYHSLALVATSASEWLIRGNCGI
ncbi:MAG: hypothetical protein HY736_00425 [Verrucomicrobia bacterium]|nr:hypothetical protein [Verrucomicrobiota bacterium]